MSQNFDLKMKRTLIFISGGGSGFGRACALSAATMFTNDSVLLICGRNLENLKQTASMVKDKNETMKVELFQLDLESLTYEETKLLFEQNLIIDSSKCFECFIIIHNAGTLGDVSKFSYQMIDKDTLEAIVRTNLTGTILVNNVLLEHIHRINTNQEALIIVVNVSSLAAIQPLTSLSMYCCVKAAREMFFRCLTKEWSQNGHLNLFVINYAPGPMDTDMVSNALQVASPSESIQIMRNLRDTKQLLAPQMSSDKLFFKILNNLSSLQSGSRFDYYDL